MGDDIWKDMKDAPKDKLVLLRVSGDNIPVIGHWCDSPATWFALFFVHSVEARTTVQPTGWHELPEDISTKESEHE